jgi:hypothetical protein
MPRDTVILARGTNPRERERSIDAICSWLTASDTIDTDTVREMHEWTEDQASTATHFQSTNAYLYVAVGEEYARDRQGPDDPAKAALKRAANDYGPATLIVDSLSGVSVDHVITVATEYNTRVHDATHSITLQPQRNGDDVPPALRRALEVLSGTAEHADALLAGVEWGGGRPPLGCTSSDGRLAPGEDYDRVCRALQRVEDGDMTKSRAADRLDCTRKTITNALDRPELYRLE